MKSKFEKIGRTQSKNIAVCRCVSTGKNFAIVNEKMQIDLEIGFKKFESVMSFSG